MKVGNKLDLQHLQYPILKGTLACVFLFVAYISNAQDCLNNLDQAKQFYQDGKLYQIPGVLADCAPDLDSDELKVEAYELLSITYLYIDEPELAEDSYLKLLAADPEYVPDSSKRVEIEFLSKRFKTTPIFTLYPLKIGATFLQPRVINVNGTDNTNNTRESYKTRAGAHIGGGADWNISKNFALGGELWFNFQEYRYNNIFFDIDSLHLSERHIGLEAPIFLRYTQQFDRWYTFAFAGYSLSYLINANATPEYFERTETLDTLNNDRIVNPDFGRNLNLNSIRKSINHNVVLGLGVNYRLDLQYISFEIRYNLGLKNVLDAKNQFDFGIDGTDTDSDPTLTDPNDDIRELTFRYGHIDNDFRLDNISINVGYVYPLYKPRKIQKKSVKGIFGNLFKKKEKTTF